MAKEDDEKKDEKMVAAKKSIDSSSPFFFYPSDNPGMTITSCILKGENYDLWVKAMRNSLRAKNKLGFVDGTIIKPKPTDPEADVWESSNSMLVSWLFNSIDSSLQPSVAYFETAKELWDDLKERFSVGNAPRIYQLKADIAGAKQQGQSVVVYYTRLKGMWDELGSYLRVPACTCGCCVCNLTSDFLREKEEEKIHQFLMGLDDVYGPIRTNILSMDPLPSLNKVYSTVIQEERHKSVVRGRDERSEAVGFAVQARKGEKPTCTHCGKVGHELSQCFEIVGYPEGWGRGRRGGRGGRGTGRGRGRGRAQVNAMQGDNNVAHDVSGPGTQSTIPGLSDEQVQQIRAILGASNITLQSNSSGKLQGNINDIRWILDSGASHHMTGEFTCLHDVCKVTPCSVQLPNGSQTVAEHEGSVCLPGGIVLKRVLYDCISRTLIGVGEHKDGVYYYHSMASSRVYHAKKNEDHVLWHQRMGHPSSQITSLLYGVKGDSSNINEPTSDKFGSRSRRCVFVGYPFGKKGWRTLDLETNEFVISRDVMFVENEFPFVKKNEDNDKRSSNSDKRDFSDLFYVHESDMTVGNEKFGNGGSKLKVRGSNSSRNECRNTDTNDDSTPEISAPVTGPSVTDSSRNECQNTDTNDGSAPDISAPVTEPNDTYVTDATTMSQEVTRESMGRTRQPPAKLRDYICYTAQVDTSYANPTSTSSSVTKEKEPEYFSEAIKNKNWRDAMKAEIEALEANGTWRVEELPQGKTPIGCIEMARGPTGLFLSQRKYTLDILAECRLLGAKPAKTPIEQNHNLSKATGVVMSDPEKYRRLIGRLIYLTFTRPELCYAVHVLAQFMQAPLETHYDAALRVVRYLKGNPGQGVSQMKPMKLFCDSQAALHIAANPVAEQRVHCYLKPKFSVAIQRMITYINNVTNCMYVYYWYQMHLHVIQSIMLGHYNSET
ncbi:hypothetical protein LUZ63_005553 [Rhynchospora breviuscula]|uniref:CCHC-type domain-containing protein n=1 Tax=Rhynchospora breviuscula TaxID=2022672 RepID=A0A9Q0CN51_9POAL|nr:hypothetical protein LUZ63_005553 [Rhynchospora breviuscula]